MASYIGHITTQNGNVVGVAANEKSAWRFQASSSFTANYIGMQIRNSLGGDFRYAVYADSSGSPGDLLGQTASHSSFNTNLDWEWHQLPIISPFSITSGNYYWIALHASNIYQVQSDSGTANQEVYNSDTFSDGISDPFGSTSNGDNETPRVYVSDSTPYEELYLDGDLAYGGSVVTGTDGEIYIVSGDQSIVSVLRFSDTELDEYIEDAGAVFGSGTVGYIDAAIDSKDIVHVVSACSSEQTRDVAYRRFGGSGPYYFNDSTPSDPNSGWSNDINAFDGDTSTYASCSVLGATYTMTGTGTNAPSGTATIGDVVWRVYGGNNSYLHCVIKYSSETLDTYEKGGTDSWSSWRTLGTPSGGWTWTKVQSLAAELYNSGIGGTVHAGAIEVLVLHPGEWSEEGWEQAANYTEQAPTRPSVSISIDSGDEPGILFVDAVKDAGSTQDNVYYTHRTSGTWDTPTQIGVRSTKTDAYWDPKITFRNSDYIEAIYYGNASNVVYYRTYTTTWGSETSTGYGAFGGTGGITSTTGGTVYRVYSAATTNENIYENTTYTGYQTVDRTANSTGYESPSLAGTTRYIFFISKPSSSVQLISNSGSGWASLGTLSTTAKYHVVAEWAYNNENQSDKINFIYSDATYLYFDSYSLVSTTSDSITADAYIATGGTTDSITADATVEKAISQSITADAIVERSRSSSFTADSVFIRTTEDSVTVDAIIFKSVSQSVTLDAVIEKTVEQSFTADASIVSTVEDSVTADAIILRAIEQSVTLDATIKASVSGSVSADSTIKSSIEQQFSVDATIVISNSDSVLVDATIKAPVADSISADATVENSIEQSFTADAYISGTVIQDITADAIIERTRESSIDSDAIVLRYNESSVTADATIKSTTEDSVTADAVIFNTISSSVYADAVIKASTSDFVNADSVILVSTQDSVTANANIKTLQSGSVTVDAAIVEVGTPVWVSPADTVTMSSTPILVFTIPESVGNMHFYMQLDTANTFDTGNLREYKTSESQANWEYWNGSDWIAVPSGGVSNVYSGNNCRYTVTTPLSATTWYRRVRGGLA